jgi:hypothetical protein
MKKPEEESEVARCRRVREERDRRFGTLDAALAHFAKLQRSSGSATKGAKRKTHKPNPPRRKASV